MEKKLISNIIDKLAVFFMVFSIYFVSFETFLLKTTTIWLLGTLLIIINVLFFKEKIDIKNKNVFLIVFLDLLIFILSLFAKNFLISLKFIILFSSAIIVFSYFKDRKYIYNTFMKLIIFFSKFFAYFTIFSVLFKDLYFKIIQFLYTPQKVYSIIGLYNQSCYSGIAGQTGSNSFLISLGIIAICSLLFLNSNINKNKRINRIYSLFLMMTALLLSNKRTMTILIIFIILLITIIGSLGKKITVKLKNFSIYVLLIGYSLILLLGFPDTFRLITRSLSYVDGSNEVVNNNVVDNDFDGFYVEENNNGLVINENIIDNEFINSLLNGRGELYTKAIIYFLQNPIVGIGIDNFTYLENIQVHNSLLQLLAEVGIIGTIFIVAIIGYFLIITIINLKKYIASHLYAFALFSEILIIIYSLTGNPFHDFNQRNYYFIILAIIIGLSSEIEKKKKNKGIITFHLAQNYGGVLQAYALNQKINDSELINYYSKSVYSFYEPFNVRKYGKFSLINILKTIYSFKNYFLKRIAFDNFRMQYLNYSDLIDNKEDLQDQCNTYIKIITGSDQVWNSDVTKDDADVYFLNLKTKAKKYAYAASIGTAKVSKKQEEEFKNSIKDFSKITVREESAKQILSKLKIKSQVVVDPTLLLNKKEWDKIALKTSYKNDYIFVYGLNRTKEFVETVNKASKKFNLPIIHLDRKNVYENELACKPYASPSEFIALIRDAKYVITDSFHCSVFSIIYHKQFISIPHITRSTRQENLLKKAGLLNHLTTDISVLKDKYKNVKLDDLRKESLEFVEEINND